MTWTKIPLAGRDGLSVVVGADPDLVEVTGRPPVGLEEDLVDLLEVDVLGLFADGFEEAGEGDVAGAADEAF